MILNEKLRHHFSFQIEIFHLNKNELISYYNDICEKNDQVLIKGSRGMQMEKIVNSIIE